MSGTFRKDPLSKKARKNQTPVIVKAVPTGIVDLEHEQHEAINGSTRIKGCKEPVKIIVKSSTLWLRREKTKKWTRVKRIY